MRRNLLKILVAASALLMLSTTVAVSVSAARPSWRVESYEYSEEYKSGQYYTNRMSVKPTGDMRTDILAIALSQIGYHEGNSRADMDGLNTRGGGNFVEFNRLSGIYDSSVDYGYAWCAAFVNWSLYEAQIPRELTGAEVSCTLWVEDFFSNQSHTETEIYKFSKGYSDTATYTPQSGDLVFFRNIGSGRISTHIGLVRYCDGEKVYTVEGNTSSKYMDAEGGQVCIKEYAIDDPYIVGYGTPKYTTKDDVPKVDYSGEKLTTGLYITSKRIGIYKSKTTENGTSGSLASYTTFTVSNIDGEWYYVDGVDNRGGKLSGWAKINGKCLQLTNDGKKIYNISYECDDDEVEGMPEDSTILEGSVGNISSEIPTKPHCTFLGWTDSSDSSEVKYKTGDEYTADADITLYPVFAKDEFKVTFVDPDGKVIKEITGKYGDELIAPAVETEPGYIHTGWDVEIPSTIEGDATYTAVIEKDPNYEQATDSHSEGCGAAISVGALSALALCPVIFIKRRKRK